MSSWQHSWKVAKEHCYCVLFHLQLWIAKQCRICFIILPTVMAIKQQQGKKSLGVNKVSSKHIPCLYRPRCRRAIDHISILHNCRPPLFLLLWYTWSAVILWLPGYRFQLSGFQRSLSFTLIVCSMKGWRQLHYAGLAVCVPWGSWAPW